MAKQTAKQPTGTGHPFAQCLYFTANAVARHITRLAEEAFAPTGLCPSGALLLSVVDDNPGITSSAAAEILHLAPSSVTRFADTLVRRKLLEREPEGRLMRLRLTADGEAAVDRVRECWEELYESYSKLVGKRHGKHIACELAEIAEQLGS